MAYYHVNLNLIMRKSNRSPPILFRLQIPPFVKARTVLEGLVLKDEDKNKVKKEITVVEVKESDLLVCVSELIGTLFGINHRFVLFRSVNRENQEESGEG